MEFTYHGLVRYGYGFFNPNHAAAAICLLLPFVWYARRVIKYKAIKAFLLICELFLYLALLFTFSRTGMLALGISAIVWWYFSRTQTDHVNFKYRNYKRVAFLLLFISFSFYVGACNRFVDTDKAAVKSTTNRFTVWKKGLQLFNHNLLGVGAGNSGKLVSIFYVKQARCSYRTLVNSFLTVLVEHGIFAGFIITFIVILSLASLYGSYRHSKTDEKLSTQYFSAFSLSLLVSGIISGSASTCFDLNMLFNKETIYNPTNDLLQKILVMAFVFILLSSCIWGVSKVKNKTKVIILSFVAAILLCISLVFIASIFDKAETFKTIAVKMSDNSWWGVFTPKEDNKKSQIYLLPDKETDVEVIKDFFIKAKPGADLFLPLGQIDNVSILSAEKTKSEFILCGNNANYTHLFASHKITLYKPKQIPDEKYLKNIKTVYLPKWDRHGDNEIWEGLQSGSNFQIKYVEY
jgi:hypothetical protein